MLNIYFVFVNLLKTASYSKVEFCLTEEHFLKVSGLTAGEEALYISSLGIRYT
jgi:hypothetical protein